MFDKLITKTNTEVLIAKMKTFLFAEIENQKTLAETAEDTETYAALNSFYNSEGELNFFTNRFEQVQEAELNAIIINPETEDTNNQNAQRLNYDTTLKIIFQGDVETTGETEEAVNKYINRVSGIVKQILISPHYQTAEHYGVNFCSLKVSNRSFFVPISQDSNYYNNVVITVTITHNENTIKNSPIALETTTAVIGQPNAEYQLKTEE